MAVSNIVTGDGSIAFDGGVDSIKPTTIASELNPNGLKRNQLAWLVNGTCRDGGISPRGGWKKIRKMSEIHDGATFQGGFIYKPISGNKDPYMVAAFSGTIYKINLDTGNTDNLSVGPGLYTNGAEPKNYFCQAEEFLIIQSGDLVSNPLFYNGVLLRQSKGITNPAVAPGTPGVNEIPAARAMDYYMGRVWYAGQRQYSAGDIVGGNSGTVFYNYRDAVLNVTENPLVLGGDGFTVPTQSTRIRALCHNANLDTATGQGVLFIGTSKAIYSLQVPVSRNDWIAADNDNQPMQTVVQLNNGIISDRSVTAVNGDLFFQSLEPGIRSLISAVRNFTQWGNTEISRNMQRILQFVNRGLLDFGSGIYFDNRLLQTTMPRQTDKGVVHDGVLALDFMPVSSFKDQVAPAWDGVWEGVQIMQLFTADFGGLERAFAIVMSTEDSEFELWEITPLDRTDDDDKRLQWVIEFPSFNWDRPFDLKKIVGAELWIDRLYGKVNFTLEYRPDGKTCWTPWQVWSECTARDSTEDSDTTNNYPVESFGDAYAQTMMVGTPPDGDCSDEMRRPNHILYQCQLRLTIKGYCRFRGLVIYGEDFKKAFYQGTFRTCQ